jgi:hypothetical protein
LQYYWLLILVCAADAFCADVVCLTYTNFIWFSSFVICSFTGQTTARSCNNALFSSQFYETNKQWNVLSRNVAGNDNQD